MPVVGPERHADVELEPERPGHQRMLLGARVGAGVLHHIGAVMADRGGAEPGQPADLALGERPVHRLVPDAVGVDEADHRHRHLEHLGGERGDPVEGAVRRRVEDGVAPERVQPLELRSRIQRHRPVPPDSPAHQPGAGDA